MSKKRGKPRSRFTTETRSPSSGFLPKPSPNDMPRTRMNRNGMTKRITRARGSRTKRRRSFLARLQIGIVRQAFVFRTWFFVLGSSYFVLRTKSKEQSTKYGALIAQGAAGQVEENALQVRLLDFQTGKLDIFFVQDRDELEERGLGVLALQLERPAVGGDETGIGKLSQTLDQRRGHGRHAEANHGLEAVQKLRERVAGDELAVIDDADVRAQ